MNRKIGFVFVIVFALTFLSFFIFSILTKKDPLDVEFNGVIRDYKRLYPSLVVFHFKEQKKEYQMSNNLEEFKTSLSIGDSISKPKNDLYIYIYKKKNNEFVFYREFLYR